MSFSEQSNDGTLSGTTPVTLVDAPSSGNTRIVKNITIQNTDTASNAISIRYVSSGGTRKIWAGTLDSGDTLVIDEVYVLDSTTKSITAVMGSSATTSNPDFTTHYAEIFSASLIDFAETSTGTYAARPASEIDGHLYFQSDGFSIDRYNSASAVSTWQTWGPIFKLTPPPSDSEFSWVNQDTATIATVNGGLYLENAISNGGAVGINCRVKSKTGTWTLTVGFMTNCTVANAISDCGILARESSTGKIAGFRQRTDTAFALDIIRWTSATVQAGTILAAVGAAHLMSGGICWQRIQNNGTNMLFSVSNNGQNFHQVGTVALTTAFTTNSDQIGFSVEPFSMAGGMHVISWVETA